jgi:hypothetical protein
LRLAVDADPDRLQAIGGLLSDAVGTDGFVASQVRVDVAAASVRLSPRRVSTVGSSRSSFATRFEAAAPPCAVVSTSGQACSADRT